MKGNSSTHIPNDKYREKYGRIKWGSDKETPANVLIEGLESCLRDSKLIRKVLKSNTEQQIKVYSGYYSA